MSGIRQDGIYIIDVYLPEDHPRAYRNKTVDQKFALVFVWELCTVTRQWSLTAVAILSNMRSNNSSTEDTEPVREGIITDHEPIIYVR